MLVKGKNEPIEWRPIEEGSVSAPNPNERRFPAAEAVPRRTVYIVLLLLSLASYRGIFDNWLFNDDLAWLRAARYGMTPGNLLTFRVVEFFRPLVNLSFWSMEKAAPGNIPIEYAFNLVLHFLCAVLVFHLTLKLLENSWLAAASAALFAVTSVHAAAVLWMSARTTLLSTFFLLASINVLLADKGGAALRTGASAALYVLALASKEEAIAGLFIVPLLFALGGKTEGRRRIPTAALAVFIVISAAYLLFRQALMGGYVRDNWGPGGHALRNVAGGFLDQLYPWPFFSLFYGAGTAIPESSSAFSPEIAALPVAGVLVLAGWVAGRSRAMILAAAWALLSLVPQSFFRYRFFSTVSISQNRYYYLSSVGTVMIIVLLLSIAWKERSRARQGATIAIFAILCAGYMARDFRLERKWDDFTRAYREIVTAIIEESDRNPGIATIAVEGSPLAVRYLNDAIALERPGRRAIEVKGGRAEALRDAPCLYVSFAGVMPRRMQVERIEP
jgi:hypothetical protein